MNLIDDNKTTTEVKESALDTLLASLRQQGMSFDQINEHINKLSLDQLRSGIPADKVKMGGKDYFKGSKVVFNLNHFC